MEMIIDRGGDGDLRSASWIMNGTGDEKTTLSIDEQGPMVVRDSAIIGCCSIASVTAVAEANHNEQDDEDVSPHCCTSHTLIRNLTSTSLALSFSFSQREIGMSLHRLRVEVPKPLKSVKSAKMYLLRMRLQAS